MAFSASRHILIAMAGVHSYFCRAGDYIQPEQPSLLQGPLVMLSTSSVHEINTYINKQKEIKKERAACCPLSPSGNWQAHLSA